MNSSVYPHFFLKKRQRGYCITKHLRLSLFYLLLNCWTKFNQIWCVIYSHELVAQQQSFLDLPHGALGRDQKVKYHLISITKSISEIFIPKTQSLFSQMKDTKHFQTRFFILSPGSCPKGSDFGALGVLRGSKKIFSNMVMWLIKLTGMTSRIECK